MAGASGCIPDYHVSVFGQLCKPAPSFSVMTAPKSETQVNVNDQANDKPAQSRTAVQAPAPDQITKLFKENQELIRGLSLGNVETYLAAVKEAFAEVRRSRRNAFVEPLQRQQLVEHQQVQHQDGHQAKHQDQHPVNHHDQQIDQQWVEQGFQHHDQIQA